MTQATKSHLIASHQERLDRAAEKEQLILDFLRDEIYSSLKILARLLDTGERNTRLTLNKMVNKKLLVHDDESMCIMGKKIVTLWGITPNGLMEGVDPEDVATMSLRTYRRGMSPLTIEHTLKVQLIRVELERRMEDFWWTSTRFFHWKNTKGKHPSKWPAYPDGLMEDEDREFAIEYEKSLKNHDRYNSIILNHLRNIDIGHYQQVFYFLDTENKKIAFRGLLVRVAENKKIAHDGLRGEELIDRYFRFYKVFE